MNCRICNNSGLRKFLSLGKTPLANSFLEAPPSNKNEITFPLEVCFCPDCKLVQLTYVVPPTIMFKNYVYLSSTSNTFLAHFGGMAEKLTKIFDLTQKSLVIDIGSNDGLLLKGFQKFGVQAVGVEPATNVAKIAEQNGVETINDFFNDNVVKTIIDRKGKADVITATNVFAHVNDISGLAKNVKSLLKEQGVFVVEVPYLVDMLEKMTFDTVYHEHLSYFSITPLLKFFEQFGMEIFNVEKVPVHGGSLRIFIKKQTGKYPIDKSVAEMLEFEKKYGIDNFEMYKKFADKVQHVKTKLVGFLKKIKMDGKTIAAYGAPAKGNTLLNYCKIGRDYIDYIVDENPLKQGLYTPGMHIPVVAPGALDKKRPDYILILAWNFTDEILNKTRRYKYAGIKFIIPLPEPIII